MKTEIRNKNDDSAQIVSSREQIVLLALCGKELYGLQIPQALADASNGKRKMLVGTLYPVLHSLEKKGLIESRWGDEGREERCGARRRYYKLTGAGISAVAEIRTFYDNLVEWQPV